MSDPSPTSTPAVLPRAVLIALMQVAERAIATIDLALSIQRTQPALPPAESEAWLQNIVVVAVNPALALWDALEEGDLRDGGRHLVLALVREIATKSAAWHTISRQFQDQAPPGEIASPAPGSSP